MCKCTPPGSHDKTTKREEYGVDDSLIQDIFHGHQLSHTVRVALKRALYFCRCRVGTVDLSTTDTGGALSWARSYNTTSAGFS